MPGEERKRERARGGVKKIEMEKENKRENDREREQRDRERECQWQREQRTDPRPYRVLSNHRTPPPAVLGRRHPFPTSQVHVSVLMDVNTCISDINQHTHPDECTLQSISALMRGAVYVGIYHFFESL